MGVSYSGESEVQVRKFLRGAKAIPEDRGNEFTTVTFSMTRRHASIQAAEQFVLTHRGGLPRQGDLEMVCDDGSGTATQSVFLASAVFKSGKSEHKGILSITNYIFVGGQPQLKKP